MLNSRCHNLSNYLNGELSASDRVDFDDHLPTCPDCRVEVDADRRLRSLLQDASTMLEVIPPALAERFQRHAHAARQQPQSDRSNVSLRKRTTAVMIALSTLALCVFMLARTPTDDTQPESVVQSDSNPARGTVDDAAAENESSGMPRVVLSEDFIGVPIKSDQPNVTILLVYPKHRTAVAPADTAAAVTNSRSFVTTSAAVPFSQNNPLPEILQ